MRSLLEALAKAEARAAGAFFAIALLAVLVVALAIVQHELDAWAARRRRRQLRRNSWIR